MFTGLIQDVGTIIDSKPVGAGRKVTIASVLTDAMETGASVACSGICLSATEFDNQHFSVDVSSHTQSITTAGSWQSGHRINLELALRAQDRMGGHFVNGHVDGLARATASVSDQQASHWHFSIPRTFAPLLARKGSITLDGVSLTINEVEDHPDGDSIIAITLIPHTLSHTTLGSLAVGDLLNFEADILARHVARILDSRLHSQ